ncbi:carbohydrate ABC transporter permease [Pseudonocardia sp. RS11V-5]|uniref:carbohydrate ABC transporter permease n=1 Tax=Pseudonocardia terrae TaxID=2905831 RepID=UPI001E593594|nr:carbohydrate ABC transporter permease [Pseudonocardia terrae]MCE3551394.1 carbohydrate ABC transporter permease [Pseudonocardia terrae]
MTAVVTTPAAPESVRPGGLVARLASRLAKSVGILALCVVCVFPVYWMLVTATLPTADLFDRTPELLPRPGDLAVFGDLVSGTPMLRWLANSTIIALGTTVISVAFGVTCGYALSRTRFHGRGVLGFALFVTQMLPEALLVVPLYAVFAALGLLNDLGGLVIVNAAFVVPIIAWMIKGAVDGVPAEIEEAARVDGCPRLATLRFVVLPVIKPSVAAAAVLAFFSAWNEYLFAATFATADAVKPTSVGLTTFIGEFATPMNVVMAGSLLYALPAVVFFMLLQRHVVSGLGAGAVKG